MEDFLQEMTYSQPVFIAVGTVLLLFGRRLYWLAFGGLAFAAGLTLADKNLELSAEMELVVALLAGVGGAIFAVLAKKIAFNLAGFGLGAVLAYYAAQPWAADLQYQIWWVVLLGGVLGLCFAAFVFNAALVVVTALLGALLITRGLVLERPEELWVFGVLALVGVIVQAKTGRKAPKG